MKDETLLVKAQSLERCVARAREERQLAGADFDTDLTRQDAAVLNVLRGCETAIDMANRMIRLRRLGLTRESRDSFEILRRAGLIDGPTCEAMVRMVGFRNIAVHEYRALDLDKVRAVIEHRLEDLLAFSKAMLHADPSA